ncbi:exocyst complex component protein [Pseudohyphozyma bogoriensis]|nr:exocyst complex component protein [Pseudohyphozyma bogoriensis]
MSSSLSAKPSGRKAVPSHSVSGPPLTLETFSASDFNVATLVEQLMDDDVRKAKAQGGAFDPQPHIQTLESALALLLPLRKANAAKTAELERSVAQAERVYRGDVRGAKAGFETVNTQFQALDSKITNVGRTAVRIGEQLESIDRLRQRASEAHDLILYYNEFALGDTSRLETMRKEGGREGRAKVAVAARRLMALAKEVEGVEGAERTKDTIERYCEKFEKEMLRLFDRYYRKGDPKAMAHCAQTLQDFNGGQSCIQIYVNQHDFFISKERVQEAAGSLVGGAIWESLPDPEAPPPKSEPGLNNLFDEIRVTVGQEAQIITAVFPNPAIVMQVFLQRVFAQVIQAYIEELIETASSSSTLAYLRILHLARASCTSLVNDLKSHDFFRTSAGGSSGPSLTSPLGQTFTSGDRNSQNMGPLISPTSQGMPGAGGAGIAAVSTMLDQAMEELFVPYMEGSRYLDKEGKSVTELYASKLFRFTNWHRAMNKAKPSNTIFDRMVNQLSTAAHQAAQNAKELVPETAPPPASAGETSRLDRLMKLSGLGNITKTSTNTAPETGELVPEMMWEEGDGELDLGTAEKMLSWHAEAVGRMVELSAAGDVPRNAFSLLKVLADSFGKAYLETALDTALHQISLYDAKAEPILAPIYVIRLADMIMHLWQRYINTALLPLAGTSVTVRREMNIFNNHVVVRIEGKVNGIVQRTTDAIVTWLAIVLAKQKKLDFKPKNDDMAFARVNTEPCIMACDFLVKVREAAVASLSGKNVEVFLTEVGVTFHTLLLDHLKRFPISATGGLMLTKDLAMYQDTITSFGLSALNDRFEMLRQLGNVFIVQPEILKSYLTESYLAKIDNRLLRPFVMQRTDFGDFSKRFWDDVLAEVKPVTGPATTNSAASTAISSSGPIPFAFGDGSGSWSSTLDGTPNAMAQRKQSLLGGLMKDLEGLGFSDRRDSLGGGGSFSVGSGGSMGHVGHYAAP